jgi:hypothetical protein
VLKALDVAVEQGLCTPPERTYLRKRIEAAQAQHALDAAIWLLGVGAKVALNPQAYGPEENWPLAVYAKTFPVGRVVGRCKIGPHTHRCDHLFALQFPGWPPLWFSQRFYGWLWRLADRYSSIYAPCERDKDAGVGRC